jgi:hypothetical protein
MQHALQSLKFCMVTSASRRQRTQRNPVAFGPNVYCIYKRFLLTRSYRNSCSGKQTSTSGRCDFHFSGVYSSRSVALFTLECANLTNRYRPLWARPRSPSSRLSNDATRKNIEKIVRLLARAWVVKSTAQKLWFCSHDVRLRIVRSLNNLSNSPCRAQTRPYPTPYP